jgi:hypothetical protein
MDLVTLDFVNKTVPKKILYNETTSSYPARPVGVPNGMVTYSGPAEPTDWLDLDDWLDWS